ncbi:MAG: TetR/AcrR family transcriptional regulator [Deltaproteobacteria bacterium]|nr:TetR/AcrR family transcriptional regulator [Candidatus Zymogenaceae bacterium]
MGRNARFTDDQFLDAALAVLSEQGPQGVTMSAIGRQMGAPIGSLYHRFPSRDHLMARLWLSIVESFQEGFLKALATGDGLSAALHTPRWVREHLNEGKVLLLFRREELMAGQWPKEMKEQATALGQYLADGVSAFVRGHFGRVTAETMRTARFALIDVPYGAVRPHLERDEAPPPIVDRLIEKTYRCIMGGSDEDMERA